MSKNKTERLTEAIEEVVGMPLHEINVRNMKEFYSKELEDWAAKKPIDVTVMRTLIRWGLVKRPVGKEWLERPRNFKEPGKRIVISVPSRYGKRPEAGEADQPPEWLAEWQAQ